jgi:hypothetical protein
MMEADESEVPKPIYMDDLKLGKVLGIYQDFVASTIPETIVCRARQAIANVLNTELIREVLKKEEFLNVLKRLRFDSVYGQFTMAVNLEISE